MWAIVEVMGHRRYAGQVEQVTHVGVPMLRIHSPEVQCPYQHRDYNGPDGATRVRTITVRYPAFQVDVAGGALFTLTPCPESAAKAAVSSSHRPDGFESVETEGPWGPDAAQLTGPVDDAVVVSEWNMAEE